MLEKIRIVATVSHVSRGIRVCIQARKRRGKNAVSNRMIGDAFQHLDTIPIVDNPSIPRSLIYAVHADSLINAGNFTARVAL